MLSPIVTYRSYTNKENRQRTIYFSPEDQDFIDLLRRNLWRKYVLLNGKELDEIEFNLEPVYPINKRNFNILDIRTQL